MYLRKCLGPPLAATLLCWLAAGGALAQAPLPAPPPLPADTPLPPAPPLPASSTPAPQARTPQKDAEVLQIGPGDQIRVDVFTRPEMGLQTYVAGDGTIRMPLAGSVKVGGMSPAEAAQQVEVALKTAQLLVNPQATVTVLQSLSRVSVLGEVKNPGRYQIDATTTVADVVALAGGRTDKGDDNVVLMREDAAGAISRSSISLSGPTADDAVPAAMTTKVKGGDRVFVPAASQFYIFGEVRNPAAYRLAPGVTVFQAITEAGGITDKGSMHRVEIKRPRPGGGFTVLSAKLTDPIQANDVVTVKERIF
jgi:polysaccharide export outer membrane protein